MCSKHLSSELRSVRTASTQNTTVVHRATEAMPAARLVKAWVTLELRRNSGACSVRAGVQWSVDGETWDTAVEFGPAFTISNGLTSDTQFRDLTVLGTRKRLGRLVLITKNSSSAEVEYCDARLDVDLTGTD